MTASRCLKVERAPEGKLWTRAVSGVIMQSMDVASLVPGLDAAALKTNPHLKKSSKGPRQKKKFGAKIKACEAFRGNFRDLFATGFQKVVHA